MTVDRSWHSAWLDILRRTGSVVKACKTVGIPRASAYEHKARYESFSSAWDEITNTYLDKLQESALLRATRGTLIERLDKEGHVISRERKYETALTIFMLQKMVPEIYGERDRGSDVDMERQRKLRAFIDQAVDANEGDENAILGDPIADA